MTTKEIKRATELLADRTDRIETIGVDGGGQYLTAHWLGGGQCLFTSLESVKAWLADRQMADEHRHWMDEQNADA